MKKLFIAWTSFQFVLLLIAIYLMVGGNSEISGFLYAGFLIQLCFYIIFLFYYFRNWFINNQN
jgi:hypothetical protein